MKKFLIPLSVIVFVISAGLVWYFGYHHQTQEAPIVVTKETRKVVPVPGKIKETHPLEDEHTQTDQIPSDDIQEPDELQPTEASEQCHAPHDYSHVSTPEYEARVKEARARLRDAEIYEQEAMAELQQARAERQQARAERQQARAERIASAQRLEETKRRLLPFITENIKRLNELPAEKQKLYWDQFRRLLERMSHEFEEGDDVDTIIQTMQEGYKEYGYQHKY